MRLIDADAILKDANEDLISDPDSTKEFYWNDGARSIIDLIETAPTIDPVRHGKWIKMSEADGVYWACSECGETLPRIPHYNPQFDLFPGLKSIDKTPYCPKCGARMDKHEETISKEEEYIKLDGYCYNYTGFNKRLSKL